MKKFVWILVLEILVVIAVTAAFKLIDQRLVAAAVAGTIFVILGLVIFIMGLRDASFRRSFTFPVGCLHLFGVALPLMIVRFLNTTVQFSEVRIWGLPGPLFHQISGGVYWLLMIAAVADAVRNWRQQRTK